MSQNQQSYVRKIRHAFVSAETEHREEMVGLFVSMKRHMVKNLKSQSVKGILDEDDLNDLVSDLITESITSDVLNDVLVEAIEEAGSK